ncbi:hypothetical protein GALMADRAFT_231682 [Galerina marginata CBS 339.88]|uniref:MYND-type domain-containing protein n=1 Tax=Galerina marginata (strain CBS 339.88) TaxID=685588 RepID=A0A067SA87_GALM3|nr:hypothetical protein GALMADRAFT_231682 [Galerina marginata CBS 339.88]
MSEFCAQCKSPNDLKRCSRCRSVSYCSKQCQIANWKSHKPQCEPVSGSDLTESPPARSQGPQSQGKSTAPLVDATLKSSLSSPTQRTDPEAVIWGVKILPNEYSKTNATKDLFISSHFKLDHPIFTRGELCPLTVLSGIPIVLYSPLLMGGSFDPKEVMSENQPAVYLRIEAHNGFAPVHWQMNGAGTCYAVRRDRQPLAKELLETIYQFHASLLSSVYFESEKPPYPITPARFQAFSDKYWQKEKKNGRTVSGGDGR